MYREFRFDWTHSLLYLHLGALLLSLSDWLGFLRNDQTCDEIIFDSFGNITQGFLLKFQYTAYPPSAMSSPPSDLSLNPSEGFDNDQIILLWLEAMVAARCPPFDKIWKEAMDALQRVAAEQTAHQDSQQKAGGG